MTKEELLNTLKNEIVGLSIDEITMEEINAIYDILEGEKVNEIYYSKRR